MGLGPARTSKSISGYEHYRAGLVAGKHTEGLMLKRAMTTYRVWRSKGAAKMDAGLWLHWTVLGRYPR
ncbi:MAG TPA: hypothetical protein DIW45_07765 [Erythrobacter sp.]|nr:hypothetical protein [Erythrobacter sp.]